jgi:lipase chaperone LimK
MVWHYVNIIVIFVLLFFVTKAHLSLHQSSYSNKQSFKSSHWLQPTYLNEQYPKLIAQDSWRVDFLSIEKMVKNIDLDTKGRLLINSDTTELLQLVNFQLNENMSSEEWQRINFLFEKSLGDNVGDVFSKLVNRYYYYKQEQQSALTEINQALQDEKLLILKAYAHKNQINQTRYFGVDIANKLFNMKNKTTNYLNARRVVNLEEDLSPAQKKDRLVILSEIYRDSLPHR